MNEQDTALTVAADAALEYARAHERFWQAVRDLEAANRAVRDAAKA